MLASKEGTVHLGLYDMEKRLETDNKFTESVIVLNKILNKISQYHVFVLQHVKHTLLGRQK